MKNGPEGIGAQVVRELQLLSYPTPDAMGNPTPLPQHYGYFTEKFYEFFDKPLYDWTTAKKHLDDAKAAAAANTDEAQKVPLQTAYQDAQAVFDRVDYLVSYRVDLINDLRLFKAAFTY
jgi:hypothetical protein